jgi:hypothetical protein
MARKGTVEIIGSASLHGVQCHPQGPRRYLRVLPFEVLAWKGRIPQDRHAGRVGHGILEQGQAFPVVPANAIALLLLDFVLLYSAQ